MYCEYCGKTTVERNGEYGLGRKPKYCSDAHKQAAYRERVAIRKIQERQRMINQRILESQS